MKDNNQKEKRLKYISFLSKVNSEKYSREEKYLFVLSRDLRHGFEAINALGVMKAESVLQTDFKNAAKQLYFDFIYDFEKLRDLMKEYRWSKEKLLESGIDFVSLKKLYFAVA